MDHSCDLLSEQCNLDRTACRGYLFPNRHHSRNHDLVRGRYMTEFLKIFGIALVIVLAIAGVFSITDALVAESEKSAAHTRDMIRGCLEVESAHLETYQLLCKSYGINIPMREEKS